MSKNKKNIKEQAYGLATLTTQGPRGSRAIAPTDEYPFTRRPKRTATGMFEQEGGADPEGLAVQRKVEELQKQILQIQIAYQEKVANRAKTTATKAASDAYQKAMDSIDKMRDQLSKVGQKPQGGGKQPQKENIMKAKDYFKDTNSNIMERMDSYRKEAKRAILMEGAMQKFFEMFDNGMTDEEIIQDYATKGTRVPEQFVGSARKQYEQYSKLKLELEMSEKEFKNSASEIINNPEGEDAMMEPEVKELSTRLFNESILKKQIIQELKNINKK